VQPIFSPVSDKVLHRLIDASPVSLLATGFRLLDEILQLAHLDVVELQGLVYDRVGENLIFLKEVLDAVEFVGIFHRGFDELVSRSSR